jgi:hypothetical protein
MVLVGLGTLLGAIVGIGSTPPSGWTASRPGLIGWEPLAPGRTLSPARRTPGHAVL